MKINTNNKHKGTRKECTLGIYLQCEHSVWVQSLSGCLKQSESFNGIVEMSFGNSNRMYINEERAYTILGCYRATSLKVTTDFSEMLKRIQKI